MEITHAGGFSAATDKKKVDSGGQSSFVKNFDAYLDSKGNHLYVTACKSLRDCVRSCRMVALFYCVHTKLSKLLLLGRASFFRLYACTF